MKEMETAFRILCSNGKPVIVSLEEAKPMPSGFTVNAYGDDISGIVSSVLDYMYDSHRGFREGYAAVAMGSRWGFVNSALKEVVEPIYEGVSDVSEGFAVVSLNGKSRLLDMRTPSPIHDSPREWEYDALSPVRNGMARVKNNGKYGFLNVEKKTLSIPCEYDGAEDFKLDSVNTVVKKDGKYGVVNKCGEIVAEFLFDKYYPNGSPANAYIGDKKYRLERDGSYREV